MKKIKEDRRIKLRFQDITMQEHYESLIKDGYHWKIAESKTIRRFEEYDN
jgi:hypothetical protein